MLVDGNAAFLRMFGYDRARLEAGTLAWPQLAPAECTCCSEAQLAKWTSSGQSGPCEKPYVRSDGGRAWMLCAGAALGDGTIVQYCVVRALPAGTYPGVPATATRARYRPRAQPSAAGAARWHDRGAQRGAGPRRGVSHPLAVRGGDAGGDWRAGTAAPPSGLGSTARHVAERERSPTRRASNASRATGPRHGRNVLHAPPRCATARSLRARCPAGCSCVTAAPESSTAASLGLVRSATPRVVVIAFTDVRIVRRTQYAMPSKPPRRARASHHTGCARRLSDCCGSQWLGTHVAGDSPFHVAARASGLQERVPCL